MPEFKLDAIDRRILENLQKDGRLTNLELADRVGLSPSPCLRRVRRLEEAKLIEGYGARLSGKTLGLGLTAFIAVSVERHTPDVAARFRREVLAMPQVTACYITSGEPDILLQVVVTDLDEYREFALERLMRLPSVKAIRSSFVIEAVKENAPLPLRHLG